MELSCIFYRLAPYLRNPASRLIRSPKLYMGDSGIAGVLHDQPGSCIGLWVNPCILLNAIVTNIYLEPLCHFLWQENHLGFSAAC
jgi:hypothetical protein